MLISRKKTKKQFATTQNLLAPHAAGGQVLPCPLREPPLGPVRHAALPARLVNHVEGREGVASEVENLHKIFQ